MSKQPLHGDSIFTLGDFLSSRECEGFVAKSETSGYEEATISTPTGFVMNKDVRDNSRLIQDDGDLAAQLWQRAEPFLPARIGDWRAKGLNERFRYYRYDPGQQFAPHYDGYFRRPNGEESQLTFMVYLNDDFTGGHTIFYDDIGATRVSVQPRRGMALVFVHRQLHEGAPVIQGRKYVLRTDVMYAHDRTEVA